MARKKKPVKKPVKSAKSTAAEPPGGFDDVDDFFFGTEAGAFKRDEFDYDPFEDHSALSGQFAAADAPPGDEKTRASVEVPTSVQKAIEAEREAAAATKREAEAASAAASDSKSKGKTAKERKADAKRRKAAEKAAKRKAEQDEKAAKRKAEQDEKAESARKREEARVADQKRRDAEAKESEQRRLAAKQRKEDERKAADEERRKEREAREADRREKEAERRAKDEARRQAAADRKKEEAEKGAERARQSATGSVETAEDPTGLPDEDPTGLPDEDPTGLPDTGDAADERRRVPLSARRAAGTAEAQSMAMEEAVFVGAGDEDEASGVVAADAGEWNGESGAPRPADLEPPAELTATVADAPAALGDWGFAITELAREAKALPKKKKATERAALLFEVGRILAQHQGDWAEAEARYEAALDCDPKFTPALRELVRVHAARQDWNRAVDLLARQADAATEDAARSAALLASAHIQLSQLDRLPEAAADLQRALKIFPDNYIALRFLREIHYRTQDWGALVDVLKSARELAGPGERLRIDYELGRLHDEVLKDPPEAIESFRACLAADGRFIPAFLAAERLLTESGRLDGLAELWRIAAASWAGPDASFCFAHAARVGAGAALDADIVDADYRASIAAADHGEVLAEEYRHWLETQGRWDDLVGACEDAMDGEPNARLRSHLGSLLGRVALQHQGDSSAAMERFDAALQADGTSAEAQEGRRQVLQAAGDWDGLLSHLAACSEAATDTREKVSINLKMAEIADVHLDDPAAAKVHLEAACGMAPSYLPALDALAETLRRIGDHAGRAERLEAAAGLVESTEARSCYLLRASRAWELAGKREKAIQALKSSSEDSPGSLLAREWLIEAYIDDGKWTEAAEALRTAAAEVDDAALKVSLLYRSGRIALSRCDDLDGAEASFRALLDKSEDFLPASAALRDLHLARGDWDAVGLLQQQEAERIANDTAKGWWHLCAGQSYERAGRTDDALGQYRAALALDPSDPVANSAIRRIFRAAGDHAALADTYGDQLRGTADPGRRDALRVQLVSTLATMGDAGSVATEINELLKSERSADLPLASLGVVGESLQIWDEAVRCYSTVGDRLEAEAPVRAACLFQQGLLLEEVQEDQVAAAALYERAHELSKGHAMALEGLERVHAQQDDGAALGAVYFREAEASETRPVETFYALLAGEQAENLNDHAGAAKAYRSAFADPVGRDRAYDALRRISVQARNGDLMKGLTEQLVADASSSEAVARWMEYAGALVTVEDEDGARAALRTALEAQPGFLPAYYHLDRLHADREEWNEVLSALEGIATNCESKEVRKAVEARTQKLLEDRGVTSDSAWDFYEKLHAREPANVVALRGLGGISLSRGDHAAAQTYFAGLAEHAADATTKAEAATQLGRIALEQDEDTAAAIGHLEQALEHHATHRPALETLKKLHTDSENWNGLVSVLARESSLADEGRRLPFFIEIAGLWEEKIGNAKVAISSWQKVLQEDPAQATALEHLLGLYESEGNWTGYLDIADKTLGSLSGAALRSRQAELGIVALEKAGDSDRALAYLEPAASSDQPALPALRALRTIAHSRGDWERVIALSEQEAKVSTDVAGRVELYEDAGRIKLDELLDRDGAALLYRKALDLDSRTAASLQFFVNYYFDIENWAEAQPVYDAYDAVITDMDLEEDDDARIEATAYHYKYGIILSHNESAQVAIQRFAKALELTPTHLPSLEAVAPRYFDAGDLERARTTYRAILRLRGGTGDPDTMTHLYLQLGRTELQLGDTASALKRFKKVLQVSKNNVEALQGIARIHRLAEDWNSLLSTYNSIIKYARDPDQVIQAYMTKGDVLEQKLRFTDKAVLHYEKVLMYDKQNVPAMTRLGQIALSRGDVGEARSLADRAIAAARLMDDKVQGALLKELAESDEVVEIPALVEAVRKAAGDGEALAAFSAALNGKTTAPRAEAAEAYRETFIAF